MPDEGVAKVLLASVVLDVAIILAGLAGLIVVGEFVLRLLGRTLGRKRDKYRRLSRLAADVQLDSLTSTLGRPPVLRREFDAPVTDYSGEELTPRKERWIFIEHFFVDRDYIVQAICDRGDRVLAYSVTTRREGFHPTFAVPLRPLWRRVWPPWRIGERPYEPLFRVTLGKTRFSELTGWGGPDKIVAWLGARAGAYSEQYYFGNPGYYQTYVFTASSAGCGPLGPIHELWPEEGAVGDFRWPDPDHSGEGPAFEELEGVEPVRQESAVTTYTVIGPGLPADDYPSMYGPHGDEVRTIPVS